MLLSPRIKKSPHFSCLYVCILGAGLVFEKLGDMSCLPCFQNKEHMGTNNESIRKNEDLPIAKPIALTTALPHIKQEDDNKADPLLGGEDEQSSTKNFTFRELATATKNFRQECLLGEGGFGRVYKGTLQGTGQMVAVRQPDRNGVHGTPDFVMGVANLNLIEHRNLVKLVGYCADGEQRLLVYEYMPMGSLRDILFESPADKNPLDWTTRMKIALGIADGLAYLHEEVDPPIIYRDLKSSNILLDEANSPRLSKYGLADLVRARSKTNISPTVVMDNGYSAPECEINGEITTKSDTYSFGVILLELISGRKAFDSTRPKEEQNLVDWARPIFRDQAKLIDVADPLLKNRFPESSLNQAVGLTAMCLQEEPSARPLVSDISSALSFLARAPPEAPIPDHLVPMLSSRMLSMSRSASVNSFSDCNKQQHTSESHDKVGEIVNPNNGDDSSSSSDYEYGESSDSSDYEGSCKNLNRSDESKKLSSTSKRKSKKEAHRNHSCRHSSRLKSRSSRSLRCETSKFPYAEKDEGKHNESK